MCWQSTRPSDRSSRYVLIDARRVFTSSKNTCYLPSRRPCFSRLFHSGRLVPRWLMVEAVSEAFAVWWCHTLGEDFSGLPLDGFYGDGIVFVAKTYQREEEMALDDARRGFAMRLIFHLFLLTIPLRNNKICISVIALGLTDLCCRWIRVDSSSLIFHICIFFFFRM